MSYELAPIVISVYTRIDHFKQCIEALQQNMLADESELFIYSDAASRPEDEELVDEVRKYSHNIVGFKKVHVVEREINYGGTQNATLAHREMTENHGKTILMEDDIVTAPGFLSFMNEAMEFYKDNENIISITGYSPPISIPDNYHGDSFILPRYNGWGTGFTWKNMKIYQVPINKDEYTNLKNKNILTVGGEDVLHMIEREVKGEVDAGDVRIMYQQAIHQKSTIYPRKSLVQNIGHDGSGVHCGTSNKFDHDKLWDKVDNFNFVKDIQVDERIRKANCKFRKVGLKGKVVDFTKQLGIYPLLAKVKSKVTR